ncbi:NADPH:quinone oxidoreductase family protein [Noviherbaspirillum cavernae]|uniref:NADPH:quinone oxidoreductase family protein n=1 Tax=Noviherbaspirillum cavernae TaxID=2320862 RepID=A0A418X3Q4_9BURK|nr:NADPH:quinone oxidoreductase family protein [Noviherbaspirillum cavernae]RJG07093.1 NADPH:quinone oxidoreductase family protein [Noviherbaspirillum cavernae]
MKAWIVQDLQGAPQLVEQPVPEPQQGQVLVRVSHAALNFSDVLMTQGAYQIKPPLPFVPGQEVSGHIERAPYGSAFKPGDLIAAKVVWGAFGEYAIVDEEKLIRVPKGLPLARAAALPVVWPTAWIALHDRAAVRAGETVLIHAAAGGVGLAAIQLAVNAGATVIATAGSDDKLELCRERGATHVINYRTSDWLQQVLDITGKKGADVIIDPVGGDITDGSMKCLAYRGRLCIVGFAGGRIAEIKSNRLLLKNASAVGVYWSHERDLDLIRRAVDDIGKQIEAGKLTVDIGSRYPMEKLNSALDDLASRKTVGKLILDIAGSD